MAKDTRAQRGSDVLWKCLARKGSLIVAEWSSYFELQQSTPLHLCAAKHASIRGDLDHAGQARKTVTSQENYVVTFAVCYSSTLRNHEALLKIEPES